MYPALKSKSKKGGISAWQNLKLGNPNRKGNTELTCIISEESKAVRNVKTGAVAARIVKVKQNRGKLQKLITSNPASNKPTKVILLVGMTGTGKSTLVDALMNYVFDVRYEDQTRLEIINLTSAESGKKANQATSQTDHITVYEIEWLAGMMIDFNLVLIDTPGLGDTRGIEYDHKMIDNIKVLFDSKEVTTLDSIAFVVKAGDARLTAQTKYTIERVLQIFGNDVKDNLVALLTFYDGHDLKARDAFKEAEIDFAADFPFNSASIFEKKTTKAIDKDILNTNPEVIQFQHFYKTSEKFFLKVNAMQSRSLQLTKEVLKDRQHIEATITGLNIRVRDLLLLKDKVDQEKRVCEQHEADAKANEDTEYEVEEQKGVCVNLEPGTYVTNCKNCNVTCHFPCAIPNDEDKKGCAAMSHDAEPSCTVCPKNCVWNVHVNNDFRYEIETVTVKKTYEDIKERHQEFLEKHKGQITIVQALEKEFKDLSDEIQGLVNTITDCLKRLTKNALRKCNTSSADYLEQMISAEDQERKPGFQRRIEQLQIEKAKAESLQNIMSGKRVY